MYITAQKVVSKDGQQGINAFLHLHSPNRQPKPATLADLAAVAESNTGKLVKDDCEVMPGGNRVKSYLDIVAPDKTGKDAILSALNEFGASINPRDMGPIVGFFNGIGIRFGAETGLSKAIQTEFDTLKSKAIAFFNQPARSKK